MRETKCKRVFTKCVFINNTKSLFAEISVETFIQMLFPKDVARFSASVPYMNVSQDEFFERFPDGNFNLFAFIYEHIGSYNKPDIGIQNLSKFQAESTMMNV